LNKISACGTIEPIQDKRNAPESFVFLGGKKKQIKETKEV
jgi:hypothetical protein